VDWFLPNDCVDLVRVHAARVFVGVPTMYKAMADAYGARPSDLASLRICFSAGAPLSDHVYRAFQSRYGLSIHQQYGTTETGTIAINRLPRPDTNVLAAGRPLPGRDVAIVSDDGTDAAPGETGEIAIRSAGTAAGYLDDPERTRLQFRDGRYFTGDLGVIDERGDLMVLGRRTCFINVAGQKVDPGEVEMVLLQFDGIVECAVVAAADRVGGEVVKAVVVTNRRIDAAEIVAFCRRHLAPHKVPRTVAFMDALPRSPTGKVLVKYLTEPAAAPSASGD
jgi:long-chain acyl-CoA synthetase